MIKPQLCKSETLKNFKKKNLSEFCLERKFDGERAIISFKDNEITIFSRKGFNVTSRYPELERLRFKLPVVLDGEICVFNGEKTDFQKLLRRSQLSIPSKIRIMKEVIPVTFVAFDILSLNGEDLRSKPLLERLKMLHDFVREQPHLKVSSFVSAEQFETLWSEANSKEWEGLVAKKLSQPYKEGKRVDWLKLKRNQTITLSVIGLETPNNAGVVALLEGGHRVQISGEPVKVGDSVVVGFLERTDDGRLRMPVKKKVLRSKGLERIGKEGKERDRNGMEGIGMERKG